MSADIGERVYGCLRSEFERMPVQLRLRSEAASFIALGRPYNGMIGRLCSQNARPSVRCGRNIKYLGHPRRIADEYDTRIVARRTNKMGFMASVAKTTSGSYAIPSCCVVVLSGGRAVQKIIDVDPSSRLSRLITPYHVLSRFITMTVCRSCYFWASSVRCGFESSIGE